MAVSRLIAREAESASFVADSRVVVGRALGLCRIVTTSNPARHSIGTAGARARSRAVTVGARARASIPLAPPAASIPGSGSNILDLRPVEGATLDLCPSSTSTLGRVQATDEVYWRQRDNVPSGRTRAGERD